MAENDKKDTNQINDVPQDKFLQTRSVMLTGEINKESAEKVIKQLLVLEHESKEPIKIFINSPGGDVEAGLAIFDMVRFIENDVFMIGMGLIASAATLVLLAVDSEHRLGLPNSTYLIHQPMSRMEGVATDVEIYAKQLEKTRDRLNNIFSEQTGQALEVIARDTDRDYWLDAKGALEYHLISKIVEHRGDL
jgi:ATP-dependent Clp protease protease subunit